MKLPYKKTVDGTTYTLTDEPAQGDEHWFLWRALDGSGKILDLTEEEITFYSQD